MGDRYYKAKGIGRQGHLEKMAYLFIYFIYLHVLSETKTEEEIWLSFDLWSWSESAPWLSCCLPRLLTIVFLAADLVHQDCIISGRMAKVHSSLSTKTVWSIWGLFSFWSGTPLPASPLHRITEAGLFLISFIGLAVYWTLVSQLLPAHLADAISLSEISVGIVLKTLSVFWEWPGRSHGACAFSKSYREETVRMTNTETIDHFWTQLKRQGVIINYFWHVLFNGLCPRNCVDGDFSKEYSVLEDRLVLLLNLRTILVFL